MHQTRGIEQRGDLVERLLHVQHDREGPSDVAGLGACLAAGANPKDQGARDRARRKIDVKIVLVMEGEGGR